LECGLLAAGKLDAALPLFSASRRSSALGANRHLFSTRCVPSSTSFN